VICQDDIPKIGMGDDQRTYVMMRNIPNQYTKEKLA
jgi:hypothetical protein